MAYTSEKEKREVAEALFADGRPLNTISNLRKGNSSPLYDGKSVLERAASTAKRRAGRYGKAIVGMAVAKH